METWGTAGNPYEVRAAEIAAAGYLFREDAGDGDSNRSGWFRQGEEGVTRVSFGDPETSNDTLRDWLFGIGLTDVTINGRAFVRIENPAAPGLPIAPEFIPRVQASAVYDSTYGWVIERELVSQLAHASYTGGGNFFYLDPVVHAIAPGLAQPKVDQETLASNAPLILAALLTAGGASGAFAGATLVEGGAVVGAGELAAAPVVLDAVAVETPAALSFSGGAPMFSAEAAAADAFVFAPEVVAPAAGELGGPALFGAEHAAQGVIGGSSFLAPAAAPAGAGFGLSELQSLVKPALGLGRAVRALVTGDAPGQGAPGAVTLPASAGSDAVWTAGTLAALFVAFQLVRG